MMYSMMYSIEDVLTVLSAVEHEHTARKTKQTAEHLIRDDFQQKHPKYTPPPWAGSRVWRLWYDANMNLHGEVEFKKRFPGYSLDPVEGVLYLRPE